MFALFVLCLLAATPTAVGPGAAPTALPANLLGNPGFEGGREPWGIIPGSANWSDFEVVNRLFRSGSRAAYLPVHAVPTTGKVRVFGVVQELKAREFPDTISGWYYVENYESGSPQTSLYLQCVVIVWGDPRTQQLVYPTAGANPKPISNYQIRYYLAGITEPPFRLQNARFKFLGKGEPAKGQWVYFETDVRKDFQELWGTVPKDYQFLRVLFEGRWDNKPDGTSVKLDCYYDDLWMGYGRAPASARPAAPKTPSAPSAKRP